MEDVKKIDLGHDDVEGQECKDGRSRTWMVLLYEDSTDMEEFRQKLNELDWNYAGRVHDQDGNKLHHHIVILFKDGRKNADIAADLGIDKRWLRAWDRQKKALRYLCHKDNPEKYQYGTDGIYGTIAEKAVAACSKGDQLSEQQAVDELFTYLDSIEGYVSIDFFMKEINKMGLFSVFRRMGAQGVAVVNAHNDRVRRAEQKAWDGGLQQRNFEGFEKRSGEMSFGERCVRLDRQGAL